MEREKRVGAHVIFIDSHRNEHNALVTEWWSDTCLNLVFVSSDELRTDRYGRQIEREPTSVVHVSLNEHGNCWKWPDE